ncbi:MAG: hypothetical protein OXJ53_07800 [Gammaproteobacteria bacterium]|nr:hypothetical protein [Gammaproteobacteria bacterium]MDE0271691.1 hypothetical protein [Gammaproteobacteria bacterium]
MSERARLLHDSPWQGVLHLTGGGTGMLSELLGEAGASRTLIEARIPYAEGSLETLLGGRPDQACSAPTARALAMAAFQRALHHGARPAFGFGVTASLATDRPKRGPCRAHLAVQTLGHTAQTQIALRGERAAQESALVKFAWQTLLGALDLGSVPQAPIDQVAAPLEWQALISGERRSTSANEAAKLILPGSFNPLHDGHERMMAVAEARLGQAGVFELSVENPDKPLLDYIEIEKRQSHFDRPLLLTRLPTFRDKADEFPGATFAVGIDTLLRIADPRYYGGAAQRDAAVAAMLDAGVSFLVFGRLIDGTFQNLSHAILPEALRGVCTEVSEDEFRADLSSTDLRRRTTPDPPAA